MNKLSLIAATILTATSFAASASHDKPTIEVGYISQTLEAKSFGVDADGDGFGVRGLMPLPMNTFLAAGYEWTTVEQAGIDADIEQARLGGGYGLAISGSLHLYGQLEYARLKLDDDSVEGFAAHVGLRGEVTPSLEMYSRIGYVDLENDADGYEAIAGASYDFGKVSLFAEYKMLSIEDVDGDESELGNLSLGLRHSF